MSINIICAVDENYGIGYKNKLLYMIPEDMKRFKDLTTNSSGHNNIVVMGRKTFESLPDILHHRTNVVITRNKKYSVPNGVVVEHDIHKIINHYKESGHQDRDCWVIGGSAIFEEFFPHADKVFLTKIHNSSKKADAYFPIEWINDFYIIEEESRYSDKYDCDYSFITYERNTL